MLYRTIVLPYAALARGLARLERLARWLAPRNARGLRKSRAELEQMSARELNDLGISRCDIDGLIDDPARWRLDRR
jgi:uncharacterized protein YjiS (DUF1127 family)